MMITKLAVYGSNLLVGALQTTVGQLSPTPNDEYNDSYYTKYTYENLEDMYNWITQALQTMNTNIATGINQGSDYVSEKIDKGTQHVAGLIGTPPTSTVTLYERLEYIENFLGVMSNDINNIGDVIGIKTQETLETNRGKTAKSAQKKKKKKNNLFPRANVEDEQDEGSGQDRLLQVSLIKQIEEKIDSQNEKIGHLEVKIDALSGLMAQILDATQQKE